MVGIRGGEEKDCNDGREGGRRENEEVDDGGIGENERMRSGVYVGEGENVYE